MNPETFREAKNNGDFTDVVNVFPPYSFFDFPFCGCNLALKEGLTVNLPICEYTEDDDIITAGGVPTDGTGEGEHDETDHEHPEDYEDDDLNTGNGTGSDGTDEECDSSADDCKRPCHKKFLEGCSDFIMKYHPADFNFLRYK